MVLRCGRLPQIPSFLHRRFLWGNPFQLHCSIFRRTRVRQSTGTIVRHTIQFCLLLIHSDVNSLLHVRIFSLKKKRPEWNTRRCFKVSETQRDVSKRRFLVVLINVERVRIALIPHARIQSHLSVIYPADEFYNIITCNIQFFVMRYAHVRRNNRISRIIIFCIIDTVAVSRTKRTILHDVNTSFKTRMIFIIFPFTSFCLGRQLTER